MSDETQLPRNAYAGRADQVDARLTLLNDIVGEEPFHLHQPGEQPHQICRRHFDAYGCQHKTFFDYYDILNALLGYTDEKLRRLGRVYARKYYETFTELIVFMSEAVLAAMNDESPELKYPTGLTDFVTVVPDDVDVNEQPGQNMEGGIPWTQTSVRGRGDSEDDYRPGPDRVVDTVRAESSDDVEMTVTTLTTLVSELQAGIVGARRDLAEIRKVLHDIHSVAVSLARSQEVAISAAYFPHHPDTGRFGGEVISQDGNLQVKSV